MIEETKEIFYNFLLESDNDILNKNYISIDLLPHLGEDPQDDYNFRQYELAKVKNIEFIVRSGYDISIREKRYLTILVEETKRLKRDIKIYLIDKENGKL